jgi:hypothetical protein
MNEIPETAVKYRFAAFGARGTITLRADCVHIRTRSYLGWWEQTIPLEHVSPNYATLTSTPGIYIWAWIMAILFAWLGIYGIIWGIALYPQKLVSGVLLLFSVWFMLYLFRRRKTEWIMFLTPQVGHGVNYTRQGPDKLECDNFTRQIVESINANRRAEKIRTTG